MAPNTSQKAIELPFAESHAFIIGINNYENISSLSTAVNDAKGIAKRLRNDHGYKVHPPLLNATKAEMIQWMEKDVPNAVGPEDRVVFYFAGHGIALDSEEGPNGYIVPADADPSSVDSLIAMADYHKMIDGLECKHGLLILDCCFAGAFKWSTGTRDVMFDMPSVIYEERFWRYVKDQAWQVITSSAYDQKAADVVSERTLGKREEEAQGDHSPFALALFEALEGEADVIPQGEESDGVITATEMYMYLRDRIEDDSSEEGKRQTPSFFNLPRHGKGEFIFFHPNHRLNLPSAPDRNPYMGLSSYNENDASLFFGRDQVIEAIEEMVKWRQLIVVSGASGTGKSSVIKAGLLPKLRKDGWQVLPVIRPGKEPKKNLEEQFPEFGKLLTDNPKSVLVIDQFEELITQCLDPNDGKAFEQQIADWVQAHPELRVILSIRSDFEPQFDESLLNPWWDKGRYIVPAFTLDEYRDVIVKPASQEVLFYEPDSLVDRLVEEVSHAPGALPLLSFTLSELYQAYLKSGRSDRALIEADYEQLGGVIGALRTRADATYKNLDKASSNSMRKLMLRMTSMEGGDLAGKRVYTEELEFSSKAETKRIKEVSDKLVEARLILSGKDNNEKTYVEPAHDALVRSWGRLWEWIKATGEEKISLHNKLSIAVSDYHEFIETAPKKARNLLWNNNPRLSLLKAELQEKGHNLNAKEEAFVLASEKRRKVARRNLIITTLAVIAGLIGLTIYAFFQQNIAKQETIKANAKTHLAQSRYLEDRDPTQAFRNAEAGYILARDNGLYLGEYADQIIKTAHNRSRFEMVDTTNIKENVTPENPLNESQSFEFNQANSKIIERDKNGKLVHEYPVEGIFDDIEAPVMDYSKISKNGRYFVVGFGPSMLTGSMYGNYYLFHYKGAAISSSKLQTSGIQSKYFFAEERGLITEVDENDRVFVFSQDEVLYKEEISGFSQQAEIIKVSPSGDYIAMGSKEGKIKVVSGESNRLLFFYTAHYSEPITDLVFCNDETILKTSTENQVKHWSLKSLSADASDNDDEKGTYTDLLKGETVHFKNVGVPFDFPGEQFEKAEPWRVYKYTKEALYSSSGDVLISLQDPGWVLPFGLEVWIVSCSIDGRYMARLPIDPELIIDRINKYKVLGEVPPLKEEHSVIVE